MSLKDWLQTSIAVCVLAGFAWGAVTYFAKAADLEMVELRLDQKLVFDSIMNYQQRMWQLEDRNGNKPCHEWSSPQDKEEYRRLQVQLEEQKKKQDKLMKK